MDVVIRPMLSEDIDGVVVVEEEAFLTPWSKDAFADEMTNQVAHYWVVELGGQIVGYAGMWLIVDEAHITNVAIAGAQRGQSLGERLMRTLMASAKEQGALKMTLEVRASNTVAQGLYEKLGFTTSGVRRQYYTDTREDALIMWCDLP